MEFEPDTFGRLNAATYDAEQDPGTTDDCVALISALAGREARILELAIGTGRIALPLAAAGHRIEGLDASPEMVAGLRAKPGGQDIPVTLGDMRTVPVAGPFDHVFLVFNTLFNLPDQQAQIDCFAHVADRLAPGGTFLIDAFVPDVTVFSGHQRMTSRKMEMDRLMFEAVQHDPVAQVMRFQRVRIGPEGTTLTPLVMRYAWPAEMDLMARLAGLRLRDRWGGWRQEPFTADSTMHVSVWEKPEA